MSHYKTIKALGTPNVVHQGVIDMLGDLEMAYFLSHFMYWSDKTENPLGVYRSNDELYQLFKWSPAKTKKVTDKLQNLGLITKTLKRLEHRMYFLFNVERFDELYELHLANQQNEDSPIAKTEIGGSPKPRLGDNDSSDSLYIQRLPTKITSENKKNKTKKQKKFVPQKPENLDEQIWLDVLTLRKNKRATESQTAWKEITKQTNEAIRQTGHSIDQVYTEWILANWTGFRADWYINRVTTGNNNERTSTHSNVNNNSKKISSKQEQKLAEQQFINEAKARRRSRDSIRDVTPSMG